MHFFEDIPTGDKLETMSMSSDNRKTIDSFLAEIGAAVGKNIRLNENGISAFTYEHLTFVIEVPENVASFFVYTTLMSLGHSANKEAAMKKMLQLNYLQQETRGGCIALDAMNDDVIFSYSDRINEINNTEFRNILENFIDTSLKLHKELNSAVAESAGANTVSGAMGMMNQQRPGMVGQQPLAGNRLGQTAQKPQEKSDNSKPSPSHHHVIISG